MPCKVLVTGGAGYLGSVLCEHLLAAGHRVTALDNLFYGQHSLFHLCARRRFDFVCGDARDERLMRAQVAEHDVLIPLAAIVGAPACDRDPLLARSLNLDAIRTLNRLRSPRQLIIYPTTNSGYGTQTGEEHCTEETPLEPISLYGRTKVDAEKDVLQSPNSITLRLATVFGTSPRMRIDLLVNHFVYAAITDGTLVLFEKDFKRNYVHIRDVADCFLHCIQNADRMVGRPYNVGLDAANLSKEDLALKIKEYVPRFYIHFAPVGSDPDKRNYIVSNQRLREAGFEARRSLDEGIQELIKGYRLLGRGAFRNA
ncbi:MAG: NAD(P)-dependent oxidoreductase [Armatimonadetes bacterium]|nr:NAD(P)-dependent oxidoreductase [Armatimonadota bacterium]